MNFVRTISTISVVAATAMATTAWAAADEQHDSHHPAATANRQTAQTTPSTQGMGMGMGGQAAMPGTADQMKAMQAMHEKMMAAKTPEEHNALMAEQMKLMQNGMAMMGRMGQGAMSGKPGDMAARQTMMEQRMDMMQSMMQMMMDRMPPEPAAK